MADTREIVVTIKGQPGGQQETAGGPGRPAATEPNKISSAGGNNVSTSANDRQQELTTVMVQLAEKALGQAVSFGLSEADYHIQRGYYLKDDYIGQRNYQLIKTVVSGVASDIGKIAAWSTLGPAGLAIGAAITVAQRVTGYSHQIQMQDLNIRQLDATLQFNRQRAGYSLSSGSVGENL